MPVDVVGASVGGGAVVCRVTGGEGDARLVGIDPERGSVLGSFWSTHQKGAVAAYVLVHVLYHGPGLGGPRGR